MAILSANEIWMATVGCSLNGQWGLNRYMYLVTSITGASATDTQFATAVDAVLAGPYKAAISNPAVYNGVKVVRYYPPPVAIPEVAILSANNGSGGPIPLPTVVCGMLKRASPNIGRKGRGRVYIPFPATTALTAPSSEPNAAYQALIAAIATAAANLTTIGTAPNQASVQLVVTGKRQVPPATQTAYFVNTFTAEPYWGSQHRRGDFGRPNAGDPISQ